MDPDNPESLLLLSWEYFTLSTSRSCDRIDLFIPYTPPALPGNVVTIIITTVSIFIVELIETTDFGMTLAWKPMPSEKILPHITHLKSLLNVSIIHHARSYLLFKFYSRGFAYDYTKPHDFHIISSGWADIYNSGGRPGERGFEPKKLDPANIHMYQGGEANDLSSHSIINIVIILIQTTILMTKYPFAIPPSPESQE